MQFYDPTGDNKYKSITSKYYTSSNDGYFFLFDLSNRESFDNIKTWLYEYETHKYETCKLKPVKILIGTKCDLINSRKISYDEAKLFADKHKMIYFETSSKTSLNVDNVFNTMAEEIIKNMKSNEKSHCCAIV